MRSFVQILIDLFIWKCIKLFLRLICWEYIIIFCLNKFIYFKRPFQNSILKDISLNSNYPCTNEKSIFELNTDYVKDFMQIYKHSGFFGFFHLNEYSHDTNMKLNWLDDQLFYFLKYFWTDTILNKNTILSIYMLYVTI